MSPRNREMCFAWLTQTGPRHTPTRDAPAADAAGIVTPARNARSGVVGRASPARSTAVFQERPHVVMRAAQMENERIAFALENQTEVQTAAAFHEGRNPTQPEARVQMRLPERIDRRRHCGENLGTASGRNRLKKSRRCESLHATRSAALEISRSLPDARARMVSRRIFKPARAVSRTVTPYSDAK